MPAVRLIFALLSFLASTLILFKVDSLALWQLKVGATELGNWFALVPLILLVVGRRRGAVDTVSAVLSLLAIVLFMSTSVRAMLFERTARGAMNAVFPAPAGAPKVPGPFSFTEIWRFSSPGTVDVQNLEFSEMNTQTLTLDFYAAKGGGPAPCVVIVHGGGWNNGTKLEFSNFSKRLAARGIAVAAIDYRLAPGSKWPAQGEDVKAAVEMLRSHAQGLGIMPDKFVLMGRSAGGQIAEAVAVNRWAPGVVGCIAMYAPADLHFAYQYASKKDILNSGKLLREYMGGTPDTAKENYDSASAYLHVSRDTVPMLLIHGLNDELVWYQQSKRLSDRLKQNGVKHVYLSVPWATHALDYNHHGPGAQLSLWAIERFVQNVTM